MMTDQYEDYIDNALLSFLHNVAQPLKYNPTNINFPQFAKRLEDLTTIITSQIDKIRDRSFQFNRLILPIVHYAKLKKDITESIVINNITNNSISYSFKYPAEIKADDLTYFLSVLLVE